MGRRTHTETLSNLLVAFLEEPVWKQTDLARRCGVGARALRTRIQDLCEAGIPIDREEDHPHVYYSVPTGWFPGRGTGVEKLDHFQIARLLGRLPHTAAREQILARLISTAFGSPTVASDAPADVTDRVLDLLEDAVKRSMPVRMGYYSASRGEHGLRTVSILRMAYGTPTRFVAFCHRASKLKWFRADRVTSPELDAAATFRQVAPRDVGAFVASSLDGFSAGDATTCSFLVREAESHWVLRTLPAGAVATVHQERGGARATLRTSGVEILARFLTGLGGIVSEIEPSSLRLRVQALAREALAASGARLSRHSARPIRSAG